jgi:O-antigen/teichoic acid export membrane protein
MKDSKKLSLLWITGLIGAGLSFGTQTLIARNLSLQSYGVFASILTLVTIVAPLCGFGANKLLLRLFGESTKLGLSKYRTVLAYITLTSFITILGLIIATAVTPRSPTERFIQILLLFHILNLVSVDVLTTNNQLLGKMSNVSNWQLGPNLLRFGLISSIIIAGLGSITTFSIAYAITGIVIFIFATLNVASFITLPAHKIDIFCKSTSSHFREDIAWAFSKSWPFGIASLAHLVFYQSDILLLSYLDTKETTGLYNVSFLILSAIYLLPAIAFQKFYLPLIHKWSHHDRDKLLGFFNKSNKISLIIGTIVFLMVFFVSAELVDFLFGEQYSRSSDILRLLSFSIPFMFLTYCSGPILTTKNNIHKKIKILVAVALINIALNIVLIPKFSYIGACASTVFCSVLLATFYYRKSIKILADS